MKTIVLAADPDSVASVLRHCIKPQPAFQILAASSIAEVLDRFVRFNGKIDLLVIDTALDPTVSSIDVALNFRYYFPSLKLLFTFHGSSLPCSQRQRTAIGVLPNRLHFLLEAAILPANAPAPDRGPPRGHAPQGRRVPGRMTPSGIMEFHAARRSRDRHQCHFHRRSHSARIGVLGRRTGARLRDPVRRL